MTKILKTNTAWKVSKYGVFSGPYFLVFGLNTEIYGVNLFRTQKNTDQKKLPYLDNFHAVQQMAKANYIVTLKNEQFSWINLLILSIYYGNILYYTFYILVPATDICLGGSLSFWSKKDFVKWNVALSAQFSNFNLSPF